MMADFTPFTCSNRETTLATSSAVLRSGISSAAFSNSSVPQPRAMEQTPVESWVRARWTGAAAFLRGAAGFDFGAGRGRARRLGLRVDPPSVNRSEVGFVPSDGAIRYSLAALKNVGRQAVEHLCAEREEGGSFRDISDFARRINPRMLNKRALETLAAAGALDELGVDRATAYANVDLLIAAGNRSQETNAEGQEVVHLAVEREHPELRISDRLLRRSETAPASFTAPDGRTGILRVFRT